MTDSRMPQILIVDAAIIALAIAYGHLVGSLGAAFGETGPVTFFSLLSTRRHRVRL